MKSEKRKRIIINADDYGWDEHSTLAILNLSRAASISSTTIMANLVSEDDLRKLKSELVGKGIHINLISGKPLLPPAQIDSLINPETGEFYNSSQLWLRFCRGKVKSREIQLETEAQIDFLRQNRISISHADSHQHLHIYPGISKPILNTLKSRGINKIRNCNIPEYWDKRRFIIKVFNTGFLMMKGNMRAPEILLSTFSFYSEVSMEIFKNSVRNAFRNTSLVELMVHPGTENRPGSYLKRKEEYQFLILDNWKDFLREEDIEMVSYADL